MYHQHSLSVSLITILILLGVLLVIFVIQGINSSNAYNNGICPYCGGTYVFKETVGHRYSTNYIYICNKCGHLFESSTYFNQSEKID